MVRDADRPRRRPPIDALLAEAAEHGDARDDAGEDALTACCLAARFADRGDPRDLDRAIDLWRRSIAASTRPPRRLWLSRPWRLLELGRVLLERGRWSGGDDDLDEASAVLACAARSTGDPVVRAICTGRRAACDHEVYLRTGRPSAARRAERRYRHAIAALCPGSPAKPMLLTELGVLVQDRVDLDGEGDLEEALALGRHAVATGPPQGPDRACHLVNLGTGWDQRYRIAGQCAAVHGGGEGPRGEARQGPSRALDGTVLLLDGWEDRPLRVLTSFETATLGG